MKIQDYCREHKIFNAVRGLNGTQLRYLLQENETIVNQSREVDGATPLHCAIYTNSINIVQILLAAGADPNSLSKTNITPLNLALKTADTNPLIIRELIKKGGSFQNKDIEHYHQRRIEVYGEKMSIKDLIGGMLKIKSQLKSSVSVEDLQKLALISSSTGNENVFDTIERPDSPMSKNLSGDYYEIEYYG